MGKSVGIIETLGYTAALKAADMLLKMAYVTVTSIELTGSGLVAVIFEGDIESVKVALEVGSEAAQSIGELVAAHSIAKPLFKLNKEEYKKEHKEGYADNTQTAAEIDDDGDDA